MTAYRRSCFLFLLLATTAARAAEPIDVGSRRELFVDDYLIERLDGATLRLHPPTPREIVLKMENPWEGLYCGYFTVLATEKGTGPICAKHPPGRSGKLDQSPFPARFRMYYRGMPKVGHTLDNEVTCCAESEDGIHWTKPDLGLFEVKGTKRNNVILARHPACHNFAPMLDANPDAPPDQRYKALGGGQESGLLALASPEGIHWKELRKEPVIANDVCGSKNVFDSQNVSFWSEREGCYVCYFRVYEEGNRVRWIARTTSKDYLSWSRPVSLALDGKPRQQLYTNQLLPYARAPHIYVGMSMRFMLNRRVLGDEQLAALGTPKQYFNECADVTLISTRGGEELKRTFLEAFIRPGLDPRSWTSRATCAAHGILQTGPEELSIYAQQHPGYPTAHLRRYTLRPDGFASVAAPFAGGEMTTKPLRFSGNRLAINFSTSAAGSVRVEIQDADGRPLPGFTLEDCPEIIGDQIERTVSWKGGPDVGSFAGKPVRLRFVLKDADLYALQFLLK